MFMSSKSDEATFVSNKSLDSIYPIKMFLHI